MLAQLCRSILNGLSGRKFDCLPMDIRPLALQNDPSFFYFKFNVFIENRILNSQ